MNRQWWYIALPDGKLGIEHFAFKSVPVPEPGAGEFLVRHLALSMMPGNRAWMQRKTYRDELAPGQVMPGRAIGRVVKSRSDHIREGDFVETQLGWQDYAVACPSEVIVRDKAKPVEHLLGILGSSGTTGYLGLFHVGRPRAGETLLISAAAGGIGSIVSQLGKIAGCRVVGIAGGPEKCRWITEVIGCDEAVDYKAPDLAGQIRRACPAGIDLFYDNTGGPILETVLGEIKDGGRIVCCGNTAEYDSKVPEAGPKGLPLSLIVKNLTMSGFTQMRFTKEKIEAHENLWRWYEQGKLKAYYHVMHGLEQAPAALIGMMRGENRGIVQVIVADGTN